MNIVPQNPHLVTSAQATWQLREALEIKLRDETWYVEEALARRLQVRWCLGGHLMPCRG